MNKKINKQYNSRDEFLNDDGLTEDEKIEIEEMILLGLEDEEESDTNEFSFVTNVLIDCPIDEFGYLPIVIFVLSIINSLHFLTILHYI